MTDRITKPITNMKEYGRKPYLEKDYQNMMEATWHKAQDNSQIVVQSVKKKPYDPFTYQEMEQKGDLPIFTYPRDNFYKWDFPFNKSDVTVPTSRYKPINPRINPTGLKYVSPNDSMSKDYRANLRWILCPDEIEAGNWYTIRVANSVKSTYKTEGGKTSLQRYIYYPSFFSFRNLTMETTGVELKVFLPSAAYDNYGSIMGLWHDSYQWYDTKKQAGQIRELINYLWQRGYAGATMEARLIANTGAEGEIELQATDGKNIIKRRIQIGLPLNCSGNPTTIIQDNSISLEVVGGVKSLEWTFTNIGTSSGFTITPNDRKATLSASATAAGTVTITVTDSKNNTCDITVLCDVGVPIYGKTDYPNTTATEDFATAIQCCINGSYGHWVYNFKPNFPNSTYSYRIYLIPSGVNWSTLYTPFKVAKEEEYYYIYYLSTSQTCSPGGFSLFWISEWTGPSTMVHVDYLFGIPYNYGTGSIGTEVTWEGF